MVPQSGGGVNYNADNVDYDNTQSSLSADNVQDAIDEVAKPAFTEASSRSNIVSGESLPTIFGKIKKFFTDLSTVAFSGSYNDLSNKPTIPSVPKIDKGYVSVGTLSSGQEVNAQINFGTTFSTNPTIVVTPYCPSGYAGYIGGNLKTIGTKGAVYCVKNSSNTSLQIGLEYIAML